jgi:hypothetical protein
MESEYRIIEGNGAEPRSGHFRILFTGYRAMPVPVSLAEIAAATDPQSAAAATSAWNTPEIEDEKAYFQADISWINLAGGDSPQTSVLTAMITGDVRGLRKPGNWSGTGQAKVSEWLPLSLGTYALVSRTNAISIGGIAIEREYVPIRPVLAASLTAGPAIASHEEGFREMPAGTGRKWETRKGTRCVVDLPLRRVNRNRMIFLTYESANALAKTDQGFGRGVFPIQCRDPYDSALEYALYFAIERL